MPTKNPKSKLRQHAIFLILLLSVGLLWSWLFLIDVARLSTAPSAKLATYITITLVYLIIVVVSAGVFTLACKYLRREAKTPHWYTPLKIFVIWAFVEALVAWLVAIIWIGRNGSLNNILPFGSLTPLLMWTPLGYLARFVGFYGLSGLVVACLACLIVKSLRRYATYYIAGLFALSGLAWGVYKTATGPTVKVTIVAEQLGTRKIVEAEGSTLVVLPEYGLDEVDNLKGRVQTRGNEAYAIGSKQTPTQNGISNNLVLASTDKGFMISQSKTRLIPGGEYLSFPVEVILRTVNKDTYTDFEVRRAIAKGDASIRPFSISDKLIVGSEACSSIINPNDYRQQTKQGATLLTNSASLEIFKGSRLFNIQHRGLAKFMAIANARPFLQSSNNWPAFALDHNGRQLAEIQPTGSAQVDVNTNRTRTVYSYLGEWVAYVGAVWLTIDLTSTWHRRPRKHK